MAARRLAAQRAAGDIHHECRADEDADASRLIAAPGTVHSRIHDAPPY
jgi:hypothetical protein